jgi:ribonuclease HII
MTDTLFDIPTLTYERALWREGVTSMAGVDEVGRGALAGPLTAAAVILPPADQIERDAGFWSCVRDSKTISGARRSELAAGIIGRCRAWGVAAIEVSELDQLGVSAANRIAMERAIMALDTEPDLLLIDAMTVDTGLPQMGIIDGDALSLSIAAASIIAKVARDTVMVEHDPTWPVFGFARHKGYGVATHLAALREHGPCPIHRRCFAPVKAAEEMRHGATRGEG